MSSDEQKTRLDRRHTAQEHRKLHRNHKYQFCYNDARRDQLLRLRDALGPQVTLVDVLNQALDALEEKLKGVGN